ncbi:MULTISPECIES: helix-turn-helix domain-containing protein [Aquimarina]|uniref:Helix-turn-helix domain-containing protein n=1 Tax=Aquimarina algiphila TaxID=2047982 RepID=A0A554VKM2_9FLAO|nr:MULTISPECIES: AraC family transcriptional regulator [Aquimarina]TSE08587.1 helix-turn-helix domain-containing protein [Aquimarina algiphila]
MKLLEQNIHREITPLTSKDCFLVFDRVKDDFDFPIHFHPEFELNFIHNGKGVRRIIGDHMMEIDNIELVLVGPNLFHGWTLHNCTQKNIHEITIQFHNDLLQDQLLSRSIMKPIKDMFERSSHGILFSKSTAEEIYPKIKNLSTLQGLEYFLSFISILHFLAISNGQQKLSIYSPTTEEFHNSDKIKIVYNYLQENFHTKIKVQDMASMLNMTEVSFSRFIKKRTGKTFIEYLNDVRVGFASQWLLEKKVSISEIAYGCGFNNVSNFNRVFKAHKGCTPTEYKKDFEGIKRVL